MSMNTKIGSMTLGVAVAITFVSYIGYANSVSGTISSNDVIDHGSNDGNFLLNCLGNDGSDDHVQWFEPLGCSSGNDSTQDMIRTDVGYTQSGSHGDIISQNMKVDTSTHQSDLYGSEFDDPYEVGWD